MLHHEILDAVLTADVVQRADVRMIEARDRFRLALEPLLEIEVARDVIGQDFDRDGALEARVACTVDLAHAAGADQRENLVGAETLTCCERHKTWRSPSSRV